MNSAIAGEFLGKRCECLRKWLEGIDVCFGKHARILSGHVTLIGADIKHGAAFYIPQQKLLSGKWIEDERTIASYVNSGTQRIRF